jgi:DNA-binding response OmpR family regulator
MHGCIGARWLVLQERKLVHMPRPTILVVEDRELARLLQRVLRTSGYRVLICRSGDQALNICARLASRIDLVLTARTLPDTNGGKLAIQLKRDHPHLKIMLMSIHYSSEMRFAHLGIEFIQKPFHYAELVAKLRQAIG